MSSSTSTNPSNINLSDPQQVHAAFQQQQQQLQFLQSQLQNLLSAQQTSNNTVINIPTPTHLPRQYDGRDGFDLEGWMISVEFWLAASCKIDDNAKIISFATCLNGAAQTWLASYRRDHPSETWKQIQTAFKNRFDPGEKGIAVRSLLSTVIREQIKLGTKGQTGKGLRNFVNTFQQVIQRFDITSKPDLMSLLIEFCKGLPKIYASKILTSQSEGKIKNIEDAYDYVIRKVHTDGLVAISSGTQSGVQSMNFHKGGYGGVNDHSSTDMDLSNLLSDFMIDEQNLEQSTPDDGERKSDTSTSQLTSAINNLSNLLKGNGAGGNFRGKSNNKFKGTGRNSNSNSGSKWEKFSWYKDIPPSMITARREKKVCFRCGRVGHLATTCSGPTNTTVPLPSN
jgi:hypothetical protein